MIVKTYKQGKNLSNKLMIVFYILGMHYVPEVHNNGIYLGSCESHKGMTNTFVWWKARTSQGVYGALCTVELRSQTPLLQQESSLTPSQDVRKGCGSSVGLLPLVKFLKVGGARW